MSELHPEPDIVIYGTPAGLTYEQIVCPHDGIDDDARCLLCRVQFCTVSGCDQLATDDDRCPQHVE